MEEGRVRREGTLSYFLNLGQNQHLSKRLLRSPRLRAIMKSFFTGSLNFFRILVDFVGGIMFLGSNLIVKYVL